MSARITLVVGVLLMAGGPQGGGKLPEPPPDAKPLPGVQQPFRTEVERDDLLQRFGPSSPLEGFYELVAMGRERAGEARTKGYLVMGRQYMSLHLQAMLPDLPAVQSAFRRYRVRGSRMMMTSMLGFRNEEGTMLVEEAGLTQTCRYDLVGPKLTLRMASGQTLEFVRIE